MGMARTWLLVAAAWIGLGAAGVAHAVNWVNIGKAPDAEGFLDIDSFSPPGTTPSFWLYLKFTEPQREKLFSQPYYGARSRYDVSCREQLVRIMNYSRLAQDGAPMASPRVNPLPHAYTPGTLLAWAAQFTCMLVEHRMPSVDLRLAGGGTPEQEFSGKDGTTSVSFPPIAYRNGQLLARVKLVSSGTEYLPSGKEYKTTIQYMLTDCAAGTHRIVARSRFEENGKGLTAQLWTPAGQQQDFEDPALKDYLLGMCRTTEARGPSGGGPGSGASAGSGFAVTRDGHIVTNQHVIDGCGPIQVRLPGSGQQVPASVRWQDKRNDIAVLKVDHAFGAVAELRARPLSLGDQVMAYGFPYTGLLASEGVFTAGMVSATAGLRDDTTRLQISNPVQPGNSGGPLLDEQGAVAGVIVSKLDAIKVLAVTGDIPQNINFAVKGEVVRLLLDTYGVQYAPGKSTRRLEPREVADRAKSFTVLITCQAEGALQTAAARPPAGARRPAVAGAAGAAGAAAVSSEVMAPAGSTVVASAAPTPVAAAAAEGMPARGERWRYGYRDYRYNSAERFFTIEVLSVQGSRVQERLVVEDGDITQDLFDADEVRFVARPVARGISVLELAPYAPVLYARADARPKGYPSANGAAWDVGKASYAEESVTVPGGTFNVLRVEVSGKAPSFGLNSSGSYALPARFTYTAWYSQDMKRYVKTRHQTWNVTGQIVGDEVTQLISHQRAK